MLGYAAVTSVHTVSGFLIARIVSANTSVVSAVVAIHLWLMRGDVKVKMRANRKFEVQVLQMKLTRQPAIGLASFKPTLPFPTFTCEQGINT